MFKKCSYRNKPTSNPDLSERVTMVRGGLWVIVGVGLIQLSVSQKSESPGVDTCVYHIEEYNFFRESYNLSYLDKLYKIVTDLDERDLLHEGTREAVMNMMVQATHGLCMVDGNSRDERQAGFVAVVLGVIGTWLLSPSLSALFHLNTVNDGSEWGHYLTKQTNRVIDQMNIRIGALEDRISADEQMIMVLATLAAERNQLEDARHNTDLLRRMLGHAELRYLRINDTKVDFNDYQAGLNGLVNLLGSFGIPEQGYRLSVTGKKGQYGNCSESTITFEASSPIPSRVCEPIVRADSDSTITSTADGKLRYLGPLSLAYRVSENKWMIPTESIVANDFPEKKNLSLHVYHGSLMVSPKNTGEVLTVCNGQPYLHTAHSNQTYSKPATCGGYYGSPAVIEDSPWANSVGVMKPNGTHIAIHYMEERNTIIYKPRAKLWQTTEKLPIPYINSTEIKQEEADEGYTMSILISIMSGLAAAAAITLVAAVIKRKRQARYVVNFSNNPEILSMSPLSRRGRTLRSVETPTASVNSARKMDEGFLRNNSSDAWMDDDVDADGECEGKEWKRRVHGGDAAWRLGRSSEEGGRNLGRNGSKEHFYECVDDVWLEDGRLAEVDLGGSVDHFYDCKEDYMKMNLGGQSTDDVKFLHKRNFQKALDDIESFRRGSLL